MTLDMIILLSIVTVVAGVATFVFNYDPKDEIEDEHGLAAIGGMMMLVGFICFIVSLLTNILLSDIRIGAIVFSVSAILLVVGMLVKSVLEGEYKLKPYVKWAAWANFVFLLTGTIGSAITLMVIK